MNSQNARGDLLPAENPDGRHPLFTIKGFVSKLSARQRRGFEFEVLSGLTAEKAREIAEVDFDGEVRVRRAVVSELVDGAIFDSRARLTKRIAPGLFSTQREIFDTAAARGPSRSKLEETLAGLGVSALQMLLLGGLPQGATIGQEALIDNAFRTVDLSRGAFDGRSAGNEEELWNGAAGN